MEKTNNTSKYPVIFEPAIEGGYNVSFPNFPGCVTFGETFEEAQQMAKEALSLWIKTLKEQKEYSSLIDKQVSPIISY
ncbi:MAG TPA: type II toxin-antitoxin system HicB family antitoxin [Candidatus Kaiserbacteria bacterium]|nr:type II toxin-antitoxin system HicB family antitoxin [Candidatus Kaiserbacteria bacterium]